MVEIRDATWDDFDSVVELLDARSRAVFGISEVQPEHIRQRWELPGFDLGWVAESEGSLVGYASLDATQEPTIAAGDPDVAGGLLERVLSRARARGFDHVALTAVRADAAVWELAEQRRLRRSTERSSACGGRSTATCPSAAWAAGSTCARTTDDDGERGQALLDDRIRGLGRRLRRARPQEAWLAFMTAHDDFDPAMWFLVERDGDARRVLLALEGVERARLGEGHRRTRERTRQGSR